MFLNCRTSGTIESQGAFMYMFGLIAPQNMMDAYLTFSVPVYIFAHLSRKSFNLFVSSLVTMNKSQSSESHNRLNGFCRVRPSLIHFFPPGRQSIRGELVCSCKTTIALCVNYDNRCVLNNVMNFLYNPPTPAANNCNIIFMLPLDVWFAKAEHLRFNESGIAIQLC